MLHDIQRHYIILSLLLKNLYNLVKFFIELRCFFVVFFYMYQFILKGIIRIQVNSQMKGYTGPGMWEGVQGFHALSGHTNLPASPCVHQFSSSGLFSFKKH